jgi:hypothetical protein
MLHELAIYRTRLVFLFCRFSSFSPSLHYFESTHQYHHQGRTFKKFPLNIITYILYKFSLKENWDFYLVGVTSLSWLACARSAVVLFDYMIQSLVEASNGCHMEDIMQVGCEPFIASKAKK